MKHNNNLRVFLNRGVIKGKIIHKARERKDIIFGAQSIKKQIGLLARRTKDFDIFTKNPKRAALKAEREFDKLTRGDNFFVEKGINPTTHKVKFIGRDRERKTKDDETIIDFTKIPRIPPKFKNINGVRFRTLKEELRAKIKSVQDPRFEFRRAKDLEDIGRILSARKSVRKG